MSQGGAFLPLPRVLDANKRVSFSTQAAFFLCPVVRQFTNHALSLSLMSDCPQDKFYSQYRQPDRYGSTRYSRKTVVICTWDISKSQPRFPPRARLRLPRPVGRS